MKLGIIKLGSEHAIPNDDKSRRMKLVSENGMSSDDKLRSMKLGSENGMLNLIWK